MKSPRQIAGCLPTRELRFDIAGFEYNPTTGEITKGGRRRDTATAGSSVHRVVWNNYVTVYAHRLAWRIQTGRWPETEIDHINQNSLDNRWVNLRLALHSQNGQNRNVFPNNTSGEKNVSWHRAAQLWQVKVIAKGKKFHAYSRSKISAILLARMIRRLAHGEFAT